MWTMRNNKALKLVFPIIKPAWFAWLATKVLTTSQMCPSTSCVPPIMTAVTIRKLDRAPNPRLEQNPTFFPKILIGRLSYLTVNPSTISIFFISSTSLERIFNRHVPGMDALASSKNGLPCPGSEKGLPVNHNPRSALQRRSLLTTHPV